VDFAPSLFNSIERWLLTNYGNAEPETPVTVNLRTYLIVSNPVVSKVKCRKAKILSRRIRTIRNNTVLLARYITCNVIYFYEKGKHKVRLNREEYTQ